MNVPCSTKDSRDYRLSQFGIDGSQDLSFLDEFSLPVPDKKIVLNQYNTPTCVGQACAMAKMISEYMLTNKWIGLSPYSVYGYYANDGGGMSIRYGVEVLYKWGCLPLENFSEKGDNPELNKALTKYRKEHPEAEEIAARYRIDSYAAVDGFDEIKAAIFNGMPVIGGVKADSSFGKRPNGIEPMRPRGKSGGHAICFIGWKKIKDKEYLIAINSWGDYDGRDGRVYIPKGRLIYEAFAISDLITPVKKKYKKLEFFIGSFQYHTPEGTVSFDSAPYIKHNRTFLPVRFVSEALGCNVFWDATNSSATIYSEEAILGIRIGDKTLTNYKTHKTVKMDAAPEIVNNRMMCPIRYLAEALECKVSWVAKESRVIIEAL